MHRLELEKAFSGRSILLTGHTGFKGSWLAELLLSFGAKLTGLSLNPEQNSLFQQLDLHKKMVDLRGDIRDPAIVKQAIRQAKPKLIIPLFLSHELPVTDQVHKYVCSNVAVQYLC